MTTPTPPAGREGPGFVFNDGGRKAAGFKGQAGDCVARAIAIAGEMPYEYVYEVLTNGLRNQRSPRGMRYDHATARRRPDSARNGVITTRKWFKDAMASWGFIWTPTMAIGSGCKVHLTAAELPQGRLVVAVSKHYTTMIDGVIHDTHDPRREIHEVGRINGVDYKTIRRRCVYGYWTLPAEASHV